MSAAFPTNPPESEPPVLLVAVAVDDFRVSTRCTYLLICAAMIGLSTVLGISDEDLVTVPLVKISLPGLCTFRTVTGIGCPGCGLTRCFVSLGHGNLGRAWRYNPAGILLFAFVAGQLPYQTLQLLRLLRGVGEVRLHPVWQGLLPGLALLLIVQWVVRTAATLL